MFACVPPDKPRPVAAAQSGGGPTFVEHPRLLPMKRGRKVEEELQVKDEPLSETEAEELQVYNADRELL